MDRVQRGFAAVALALWALVAGLAVAQEAAADGVNVYISRHYDTDLALYDRFTAETGIPVRVVEGRAEELIVRIGAEGEFSPADLLITVDAGNLWRADQAGLFQPLQDADIRARIPAHLQHPDAHWIALSKRARVIIYDRARGRPEGLETYEDLADPAYRGMVCVRSSSNIYNQSLMAAMIAHHGEAAAEEWAKGVVANFARRPQGNDTAQIRAVAAGACRLAIVNSYYVGRLLGAEDPDQRAVGDAVGIIFPNQDGRGTHVNVSGAGLLAHAPNPDAARQFLDFLTRAEAQTAFAEGNNEYPAARDVPATGPIAGFGDFVEDDLDLTALGRYQPAAIQVFDRVGWP